jgi:hypothetical protein
MDKDLHQLYSFSMKPILDKSTHKSFLTQQEFEENYGIITIITRHRDNLEKKLKQIQK